MFSRIKSFLGRASIQLLLFLPQLILLGTIFVPLNYLGFPWWVDALIAIFTVVFEKLGGLVYYIVWIWSFIIFVRTPFNSYSILYIVFLLLYIFLVILRRNKLRRK